MTFSPRGGGSSGRETPEIKVRARAKINLALDVLGKRPDGYHELRTVMQSVELSDRLTLANTGSVPETAESPVELICSPTVLPADRRNIVRRAAEFMHREFGLKSGIRILLEKTIPMEAGLAGGSADCAAAIRGINALFGLGLGEAEMTAIAGGFGSDAPFCVMGGSALAEGRGERLTRLPALAGVPVVIAKPPAGMSTAEVYARYDAERVDKRARAEGGARLGENSRANGGLWLDEKAWADGGARLGDNSQANGGLWLGERPDIDAMINAVRNGDVKVVAEKLGNALEAVSSSRCPEIPEIKRIMLLNRAMGAAMSGSGSSVFGLFADRADAEAAARAVRARIPEADVFVTETGGGNAAEETGGAG